MNLHVSVLLAEIIDAARTSPLREEDAILIDGTAGAGGHLTECLLASPRWRGLAIDRDPEAQARVMKTAHDKGVEARVDFRAGVFSKRPDFDGKLAFVLADLGISSFQIDDPARGLSLRSEQAPDFRMDPTRGASFSEWLAATSEADLVEILDGFGEEPKARKLARDLKSWGGDAFVSAKTLADRISKSLNYGSDSRIHPATRAFQAFRMAINDEVGELKALLRWAPDALAVGGRLAIISFHSIEDRLVKNRFRDLAEDGAFDILSKRPVIPSDEEIAANPRSRSAKLRILERRR